MSAARVIPFPVRADSQHEISGATAKGGTMLFRRWVTPAELMDRWRCWPFQLAEAWFAGLPVYSSINGVRVAPGSSCLECTSGSINGDKACDDELCLHAWTYEGHCHESGHIDEDYYRADTGIIGYRIASGAFTFDLDEVESFERAHGLAADIPPEPAQVHDLEETAEALVTRLKRAPLHDGEIMLEVQKRWGKPPRKIMERAEIAALVTGESPPCKKADGSRWYELETVFKNTVAAHRRQKIK